MIRKMTAVTCFIAAVTSIFITSQIIKTRAYHGQFCDEIHSEGYVVNYDVDQTDSADDEEYGAECVKTDGESLELAAPCIYLCDYGTGTLIYAKNENDRRPIASMTKIMLLILAFEQEEAGTLSFDETIKVSANASGMGGSQVFLETDGEYRAGELIKSIIVSSANDASVAIAERLFGSEKCAVNEMNAKAEAMGLKNTLFSNCTGLMKPTQYSSAKDVAAMLSELIKHEKYFDYSRIYLDEITHSNDRKTMITNTNKLVKYYNGCDGGKTGFTNEAGFCLAATAKRGATRLVSVVIGEKDGKQRFADSAALFNYGFDNYSSKMVLSTESQEYQVEVKNGKQEYVFAVPENDLYVFGHNNVKENVQIVFEPADNVKAPIARGDKVGKFVLFKDDIKIGEYKATSFSSVGRLSYKDYLEQIASA